MSAGIAARACSIHCQNIYLQETQQCLCVSPHPVYLKIPPHWPQHMWDLHRRGCNWFGSISLGLQPHHLHLIKSEPPGSRARSLNLWEQIETKSQKFVSWKEPWFIFFLPQGAQCFKRKQQRDSNKDIATTTNQFIWATQNLYWLQTFSLLA